MSYTLYVCVLFHTHSRASYNIQY